MALTGCALAIRTGWMRAVVPAFRLAHACRAHILLSSMPLAVVFGITANHDGQGAAALRHDERTEQSGRKESALIRS